MPDPSAIAIGITSGAAGSGLAGFLVWHVFSRLSRQEDRVEANRRDQEARWAEQASCNLETARALARIEQRLEDLCKAVNGMGKP